MARSRVSITLLATAGLLGAGSCAPAPAPPPATQLAELAGRTAGTPQRCVATNQTESLRPAGRERLLFGRGETVWVNELGGGCEGFRPSDVLVVEPIGAQYCRGDRVRSFDPVSRIPGPACSLGDYVPYRR